jgi:CubicO group peptidase (beta-lactamase class C family)
MTTNHLPGIFPRPGRGFGFGFQIIERFGANGLVPEGVFSWGGAYSSDYFVDRSSGIVALLLTQTLPNTTDIRLKFPTMVYQAVIEP